MEIMRLFQFWMEPKFVKRRAFLRKHYSFLVWMVLGFTLLAFVQLGSYVLKQRDLLNSQLKEREEGKALRNKQLDLLNELIAMGAVREINSDGSKTLADEEVEKKQWEEAIKTHVTEPVPQTEPTETDDKLEETNSTNSVVTSSETSPVVGEEGNEGRPLVASDNCIGRHIYMYDLPPFFNQAYLNNCSRIHRSVNMCDAFSHYGAGAPANRPYDNGTLPKPLIPETAWYETDQFSLEILFHARMKEYPCLTKNPLEAVVFYVPFYPGLAIFRSLYDKDKEKDRHAQALVDWLHGLPWWDRHNGKDHLMVITRVLIDFTRDVVRRDWGNHLMSMSHMRNATFIGIEAHPIRRETSNAHSIPYPTSFHPSTDEDIRAWQTFVRNHKKEYLIGFAGVGHGMGANIRNLLYRLCINQTEDVCKFFDCKNRVCIMKPQNVVHFYLGGTFCLQPPGDTPTRKGLFDSILAGCIPVVFHEQTSYTYKWHLPANQEDVVVYMPMKNVLRDKGVAVIPLLKTFSPQQIYRMQQRLIDLIPHIMYAMPGNTIQKHKDAFNIAVESVLKITSALKLPQIVPEKMEASGS